MKPTLGSYEDLTDGTAIEIVALLRHRTGATRACRCIECRAILRVVQLATKSMRVGLEHQRAARPEPEPPPFERKPIVPRPEPLPMSPGLPGDMLRMREVKRYTGLSTSTIYNYIKHGTFPKPLALGERSSAWKRSEVEAWIADRPRR